MPQGLPRAGCRDRTGRSADPRRAGRRCPWEAQHQGQALLLSERLGGFDRAASLGVDRGTPVLAPRSGRTGVALDRKPLPRHRRRQRDPRAGMVDREHPAVSGHVPVELVVVLEETELAVRAVAEDVLVLARDEENLCIAEPGAHAVRQPLHAPGLGLAVTRHFQGHEVHPHAPPVVRAVIGREIAVDAVVDVPAFGVHADRLRDLELAVGADGDLVMEGEDALLGRCHRAAEQRNKEEQPFESPHRSLPFAVIHVPHEHHRAGKANTRRAEAPTGPHPLLHHARRRRGRRALSRHFRRACGAGAGHARAG